MIEIKPMDEDYILPRCLHEGPIDTTREPSSGNADASWLPPHPWSDETLEEWAADNRGPCQGHPEFAREMIERYGTCALLAWEGWSVVGFAKFYPMTVARMMVPAEPEPILDPKLACDPEEDEGTLWVECVMTCRPYLGRRDDAPAEARRSPHFRAAAEAGGRRGIGLALAKALIPWAQEHGWQRIIKIAHPDLDVYYGQWGGGGRIFWEKGGFRVVGSVHKPQKWPMELWPLVAMLRSQAAEKGLSEEDVWTYYRMARDLQS